MILAGQLESHHRPCYRNPTFAKRPDYPPITSKPTTGETAPTHLSLPSFPIHSGQTRIWPQATQKPSPPGPSVKHWKTQNYPKHLSEAKKVWKHSSNPLVLLPEMVFVPTVLWHTEIYGQQAHSVPGGGRMINSTLFPNPTLLCLWLVLLHFPSLSFYYNNSEVQLTFTFFFLTWKCISLC